MSELPQAPPVILVATDGSPSALAAARQARDLFPDADPVVVSVVAAYENPELDAGGIEGPTGDPHAAWEEHRAHRVDASGALAATARQFGPVPVRQLVVEADDTHVGAALARVADEQDAAVVVVGRSQHGPLTRLLTGSAEEYLVRHGRRPVLVVPAPASDDD